LLRKDEESVLKAWGDTVLRSSTPCFAASYLNSVTAGEAGL